MSDYFATQAGVETAENSAKSENISNMVVPIDLTQVHNFSELKKVQQSAPARKAQLRRIVEDAMDEEWNNVTPLLSPHGDYAGGAQFAHAIVCDRIHQAREDQFDFVSKGGDNPQRVTLRELWPIVHEELKKRGLVFNGGFVTGIRR